MLANGRKPVVWQKRPQGDIERSNERRESRLRKRNGSWYMKSVVVIVRIVVVSWS